MSASSLPEGLLERTLIAHSETEVVEALRILRERLEKAIVAKAFLSFLTCGQKGLVLIYCTGDPNLANEDVLRSELQLAMQLAEEAFGAGEGFEIWVLRTSVGALASPRAEFSVS